MDAIFKITYNLFHKIDFIASKIGGFWGDEKLQVNGGSWIFVVVYFTFQRIMRVLKRKTKNT